MGLVQFNSVPGAGRNQRFPSPDCLYILVSKGNKAGYSWTRNVSRGGFLPKALRIVCNSESPALSSTGLGYREMWNLFSSGRRQKPEFKLFLGMDFPTLYVIFLIKPPSMKLIYSFFNIIVFNLTLGRTKK